MTFLALHTGSGGSVLTSWTFVSHIAIGCLIAGIAYGLGIWMIRRRHRRGLAAWRILLFYLGLYAVALALIGPLDTWNDDLFSIHMLQHLLLMMVAAPCLLLGRPVQVALQALPARYSGRAFGWLVRPRSVRWTLGILTAPVVVFFIYNVNLVAWHLPDVYDLALRNDLIHELEHVAFFCTALLFWWIIIDPVPRHHKISPHWLFGLAFATCMVGSTLAAGLTLSTRVLYPTYLTTENPWGLSPLTDQHIGGGIMWISGAVYFGILFGIIYSMVEPDSNLPVTPSSPSRS